MELTRAKASDIPFIMNTERIPGYEEFIGQWDEARHLDNLADPHNAYFVARDGAEPVGFTIVRDWNSPERVTYLQRIAVARPNGGHGKTLVSKVLAAIFQQTQAHRVWLKVFPENLRAQRVYLALGFRSEGIARGASYRGDGVFRDQMVMAILRPEWIEREQGASAE
jgi:diamine N-acetyltransferase